VFGGIKNWIIVIVAVALTAIVAAVPVSAATLTSLVDNPTSQEVSTAADHTLIFTTPSGVAEGDTMLVTFDTSFDTSTLIEDDLDVVDDGVDLTTASDCTGSEEASVSIAADVVTITICAGDGGAITAASEVTIEIGTKATASGTGANQVINPTVEATFQIRVSGTFGDSGSVWTPIVTDEGVGVSLTVPGGGGPVGPGGPGPGDATPPVISDVQVVVLDDTSAWVIWDTDESANSNVDYGQTESYEIGTESDGTYRVNHALTLYNLIPGTLHYFQVRSSDNNGNQATDSGYSFTTTDTTAPILSNIEVVDITTSSARVTWETDELTDSSLSYGIDETYGSEIDDATLSTEHSLILLLLDDDTEYHFMVSSTDGFGNVVRSSDQTFTTLVDDPPVNVSNLSVVAGDTQNQLTWTNPEEDDLSNIQIIYKIDGYPTGPYDGSLIYSDTGESYLHTGLTNEQGYYYGVFVYDLAGQVSSGALGFGMPQAVADEEEETEDEDEEIPPDEPGEDEPIDDEEEPGEDEPIDEEAYCGDGVCGQGEDFDSCPADCPELDQPSEDDEEPEVEFLVAKNQFELIPANGFIDLLTGTELQVRLDVSDISQTIDHVELVLGNDLYLLVVDPEQDNEYFADIYSPTESDAYYISITVYYIDDSGERLEYTAQVNSFGYTFEMIEGEAERVGDSTVTLFSNVTGTWQVWDASEYGQLNPVITPADGSFAWYVPIADYYILAEKEGYDQTETEMVFVMTGVINSEIEMQQLPPPFEEVIAVITSDEPILDRVTEAVEMLGDQISFVLEEIRETPGVIESAEIALPILVAASAVSLGLMAIFFNLLPFLQYLFTAPLLFFWRRKRKGWGVIYNAVTKIPIGLVVVRLYQLPDEPVTGVHPSSGRLLQTRVTDKEGRYFFLADKGTYRIQVVKPGFVFPHKYLQGVKDDGHYFDVYHGESVDVSEHGATIAANVPMMPEGATRMNTPGRVKLIKVFRTIQKYAAIVGVLFAAIVCLIIPSTFTISVAIAQVFIYFLFNHLTKVRKPKGWGIVYDKNNGQPLSNTVVRIFEPKYNKLLETAITDRKGRYSFLVGPNEYYTRYEHKGYQPFEYRPIDLKDNKEPTDVSIDVRMEQGLETAAPTIQLPENKKSGEAGPGSAGENQETK